MDPLIFHLDNQVFIPHLILLMLIFNLFLSFIYCTVDFISRTVSLKDRKIPGSPNTAIASGPYFLSNCFLIVYTAKEMLKINHSQNVDSVKITTMNQLI